MAEFTEDLAIARNPIEVQYCGACSLPPEYCEFGSTSQQVLCNQWAATKSSVSEFLVKEMTNLNLSEGIDLSDQIKSESKISKDESATDISVEVPSVLQTTEDSTSKKKSSKKKSSAEPMVKIGRVIRNRRKYITIVGGLGTFPGIKLKDAAKLMGRQFACGCSVNKTASGAEEIIIQGDVLYDLPSFLENSFSIPAAQISVVGE